MDQDMRKWIEQQRRLAREGKLPKERLDVLALVDIPFARRCLEEMGMSLDEDEEKEEEKEEDPDYDSEASDEDLDSHDYTLDSSYSCSDSATDSDYEDYEDWPEGISSPFFFFLFLSFCLRFRSRGDGKAPTSSRPVFVEGPEQQAPLRPAPEIVRDQREARHATQQHDQLNCDGWRQEATKRR